MIPGLEAAKAYAALIGSVATALLGIFTADTTVGLVLTCIAAVATTVATFAVPNTMPFTGSHGVRKARRVTKRPTR